MLNNSSNFFHSQTEVKNRASGQMRILHPLEWFRDTAGVFIKTNTGESDLWVSEIHSIMRKTAVFFNFADFWDSCHCSQHIFIMISVSNHAFVCSLVLFRTQSVLFVSMAVRNRLFDEYYSTWKFYEKYCACAQYFS